MPSRARLRRRERDGPAVQSNDAALGCDQAGDDLQHGRLAGTIGAQQRQHLAAVHLERHVEQDLDCAVAQVDVGQLDHRDRVRSLAPPFVFGHLSREARQRRAEATTDVPSRAAVDHQATDDVGGDGEDEDRDRVLYSSVSHAEASEPPIADQEDVSVITARLRPHSGRARCAG